MVKVTQKGKQSCFHLRLLFTICYLSTL